MNKGSIIRDWMNYYVTSEELEFYLKNYKILIIN